MFNISEDLIDKFIAEDVPYFDLTTWALDIGEQDGIIEFFTREDMILCGTEEVKRIFDKFSVEIIDAKPSGTPVKANEVFISAKGKAESLHMVWKVCQNLLDHCSAISTKTRKMLDIAKKNNPDIMVVTTRKGFPGTKSLAIKSVLMGGAFPHRLGLSETVLVFKQHMNFMGGLEAFAEKIPEIKTKICEKKLIAEADSAQDGIYLSKMGVDGIQFDKLKPDELKYAVENIRKLTHHVTLLAAGGINESNVAEYAATGVDAIVTTSLYSVKPVDIGVKISKR